MGKQHIINIIKINGLLLSTEFYNCCILNNDVGELNAVNIMILFYLKLEFTILTPKMTSKSLVMTSELRLEILFRPKDIISVILNLLTFWFTNQLFYDLACVFYLNS